MRVRNDSPTCARCGAILASTATAQELARHRASRLCQTAPERHRLRALGWRVVTDEAGRWLKAQGVATCEADTDPDVLGVDPVARQCWVPAWAAVLVEARAEVPRLIVRAAVWRASRFDAQAEAFLTMDRLGGADVVRDYLLNDPVMLRAAVNQATQLLAQHGWTDA